ncbi:(2Fe-2S)-binding protein [Bradyrhizobium diazoefficiens]|uniref:(2Fe-2S)-binding protein n=1 Tax=Bradyrhizobium diazoefficiens TaxID=1355477 RepID=UPI0035158B1D
MFKKVSEKESAAVLLYVDDEPVDGFEGETVASALMRLKPLYARTSPVNGGRRAPYCMMGVCFDCLAVVDGVASVQTCLTPVREGMRVERQDGRCKVLT